MRSLLAALCAIALLIAGCTSSAGPKFSLASALALMGDGGRIAVYDKGANGHFEKKDAIAIERLADRRYLAKDPNETITFSLHRLGAYIVIQAKSEKSARYDYAFARLAGKELHRLKLDWGAQDRARLTALGVTDIGQYSGKIDNVTDMAAFVAALKFGGVDQKYARE